jgi:hypothetical protein
MCNRTAGNMQQKSGSPSLSMEQANKTGVLTAGRQADSTLQFDGSRSHLKPKLKVVPPR